MREGREGGREGERGGWREGGRERRSDVCSLMMTFYLSSISCMCHSDTCEIRRELQWKTTHTHSHTHTHTQPLLTP